MEIVASLVTLEFSDSDSNLEDEKESPKSPSRPAPASPAAQTGTPRRASLAAKQGPRRGSLVGLALTAQDLPSTKPAEEEAELNHERSQELFSQVIQGAGILSTSRAPHVTASSASSEVLRKTVAQRLLGRLKERGVHGFRTLRLMLHSMDLAGTGRIQTGALQGALIHMGFRALAEDVEQVTLLFRSEAQEDRGETEQEAMLDYVALLSYVCSNWSQLREDVVREAYEALCKSSPGGLLWLGALTRKFLPEALTEEYLPELANSMEKNSMAYEGFLQQWRNASPRADGLLSWLDFAAYYLDVSVQVDSDHDFCKLVCRSWGVDMDDHLAKVAFLQFSSPDDPGLVPLEEFQQMLSEMEPGLSEEEAAVWISTVRGVSEGSGDISLTDFLRSKVLKVRRLYQTFVRSGTRAASQNEFFDIIYSLSPGLQSDEALAVYEYASVGAEGTVSIVNFLRRSILQLLKLRDHFQTPTRKLSEVEARHFIRTLDSTLSERDCILIYRAIDTAGSGKISFVDFCDSHVFRLKDLLDRYDVDHTRAVSTMKLREMMQELDPCLGTAQLEDICRLYSNSVSGKVSLKDLLHPNIVRLLLLFQKRDHSRSYRVSAADFKAMIRDVFKGCTEKEAEELHRVISPENPIREVSFSAYLLNFPDLARRFGELKLAARREHRHKAQSKGLALRQLS